MTNGDRIRRMTDEQIVDEILKYTDKLYACKHCTRQSVICYKNVNCRKHILKWLKQEANEDAEESL